MLLHIYAVHAWPNGNEEEEAPKYTNVNGTHMNGNGRARTNSEAQRIQDAEGFELQGLISDDEDEQEGTSMGPKKTTDEEMGAKETTHA